MEGGGHAQPELIATASPADTGKRPCRAGDPLTWLCCHPFHLQSARSVLEVGLDLRKATSEKGLCQPAPRSPPASPLPTLTLFMLRLEFLLDLIRGQLVCVQFSSTQCCHDSGPLCQVQKHLLGRGQ